ncbi:MAG: phosphotransferase [Acidimicrobiia bacterium]|nr:phosphotransferase [Acidimicrobiia bacterium]
MKDWDQLTEVGQIRRLRPLAWRALDSFPIAPTRLRLVGGFTNVIFRVETDCGPYALRVDLHQDHSDEDVHNELAWLAALAAETDLDVCRFVRANDGAPFVYATSDGVPGTRRCILFEWIPGRPLADSLTESAYHQLGRLAASLHRHGATFTPPHRPLTWDRIFYWPEEVDPVVIYEQRMERFIDPARRRILEGAIKLIEPAFARLDPAAAQVIHGDLHPWNVHRYRNRLIAFDFEDVTWGHPVQDIAITLFYERNHPAYEDLRAAFTEGYRSIAVWPVSYEGEIERFMAARSVMFVNYVANLHDDPSDYYKTVFPRLERFVAQWGGS